MESRTLIFEGSTAIEAAKALGSDVRTAILEMVGKEPMTITQLAAELGIAQPAVTNHVRLLEQAGLLKTFSGTGERGATKLCQRTYDEVSLKFTPVPSTKPGDQTVLSMPVGSYTRCDIHPTCGLATTESFVGYQDFPRSFFLPERMNASILWFGWGFVEYEFINPLLSSQVLERLDFSVEICSEAPGYAEDYPSDITFSIDDREVGMWTCPGDMGEKPGRLNPPWWGQKVTKYGFLKTLSVRESGTFIDGTRVSSITTTDILDYSRPSITVRLAVHENARHCGGLTIFGKSFGNYAQDLILTLVTRQK